MVLVHDLSKLIHRLIFKNQKPYCHKVMKWNVLLYIVGHHFNNYHPLSHIAGNDPVILLFIQKCLLEPETIAILFM